jgi:hypothetical protein
LVSLHKQPLRVKAFHGSDRTSNGIGNKSLPLYMQLYPISINRINTPMGTVNCGLKGNPSSCEPTGPYYYDNGFSSIINMPNYKVEIFNFELPKPQDSSDYITGLHGWLWRIEKLTDAKEPLELYCKFTSSKGAGVSYSTACGESLDAIEVYNQDWILHIGTEDGETMQSRAINDDGMPPRFKESLNFHTSFTMMKRTGLLTAIPHLNQGEHFHMHYLAAYGKQHEELNGFGPTWSAVDVAKRKIENWIGVW